MVTTTFCLRYCCLLLMIMSCFCGGNETLAQVESQEPIDVSLIQLIANPNEYHGKFVRLIGFCRLEFEGDALFLHREECPCNLSAGRLDFSNSLILDQTRLFHELILKVP